MILLETRYACRLCPLSLICIGDHWSVMSCRNVHLRRCRRCRRVFFTVGDQQYLCAHFPVDDAHWFGTTDGGCIHSFTADCIEHHEDDFTARY